jgi:hypothetical protein
MDANTVIFSELLTQHAAGFAVERYTSDQKAEWDEFVCDAKNGTFLLQRNYMDYHCDRFVDYSLMVYRGNKLMALLPGNLNDEGCVVSHGGLTYGGLVLSKSASFLKMMGSFKAVLCYLWEHGIPTLYYKPVPSFYCTISNEDMALVLFQLEARICQRDAIVAINQADRLAFRKGRKSEISKAKRSGVTLAGGMDFAPFWEEILIPRLSEQYGVSPVHSVEEIAGLAARFPGNIKQFSAYFEGRIVAGATIYETPRVAHAQYIAVSELGQKTGALDYLFDWLINDCYGHKAYFDFGSCKKSDRTTFNYGLLNWKESFGGRCYSHDFYAIATENHRMLAQSQP